MTGRRVQLINILKPLLYKLLRDLSGLEGLFTSFARIISSLPRSSTSFLVWRRLRLIDHWVQDIVTLAQQHFIELTPLLHILLHERQAHLLILSLLLLLLFKELPLMSIFDRAHCSLYSRDGLLR